MDKFFRESRAAAKEKSRAAAKEKCVAVAKIGHDIEQLEMVYDFSRFDMSVDYISDPDTVLGRYKILCYIKLYIPTYYEGASYNTPLEIRFNDFFPNSPPEVYVKPTANMTVCTGEHVDSNGRVLTPYLIHWTRSSVLLDMVNELTTVFNKKPPLMTKQGSYDQFYKEKILNQPKYKYPFKAIADLTVVAQRYCDLRPDIEILDSNHLLVLRGTIPVQHKGITYNFPIAVWISYHHPYEQPIVYVKPTSDMVIAAGDHVATNGRVIIPYLRSWKYQGSTLVGLLEELTIIFSEIPPVYRVPDEIQKMDTRMVEMYIKALKEGTEKRNKIRMMIVGHYGVGKTSLTRKLLEKPVDLVESTNGIDVHTCLFSVNGKWETIDTLSIESNSIERIANVATNIKAVHKERQDTNDIATEDDNSSSAIAAAVSNQMVSLSATSAEPSVPSSNTTSKQKITNEQIQSFVKCMNKNHLQTTDLSRSATIWDFGGQYIFYATHQLFHSRRAVYILVFDVSQSLNTMISDEDFPDGKHTKDVTSFAKFWMHSIHAYVGTQDGEPPVILVGTHKDKIVGDTEEKYKVMESYFEDVRKLFDGTPVLNHIQPKEFLVDNLAENDDAIIELKKYIVDMAESSHIWEQELPAKWIPLEDRLSERRGRKHITFEELCQIDAESDVPLGDQNHIKLFLAYHHECGNFVYFNEPELSDIVVIDPQWIIDAFKCIISSSKFCRCTPALRPLWNKLIHEAILEPKLIENVWSNDANQDFYENKAILLSFLQKLGIISNARQLKEESGEIEELPYFVVPSLLKSQCGVNDVARFLESRKGTTTSLVYDFGKACVSPTLYHHVTAIMLGRWPIIEHEGKQMLFENIGIYEIDMKHAGIIEVTETTLEIRLVNMCGEDVDSMQSDLLRRYIEMILNHELRRFRIDAELQYTLCVRCNIGNNRGKKILAFKRIRDHETIPCPDHTVGHVLSVTTIMQQWFPNDENNSETSRNSIMKCLASNKYNRKVTENELSRIACTIGLNWELLGSQLGISQAKVEQIKMDLPGRSVSQIFKMLDTWQKKNDESATLSVLLSTLLDIRDVTVEIDGIKNIIDGFPW